MSYSSLVEYVRLSPNCSKPRSRKVDTITIHHMAGNLTVETCGAGFADPKRRASSNYGIGTDGRVACYVEEENMAWTSSDSANDNRAITIEVANCSGEPDWKVSDQAMESLIALCVDICRRYGFRLNYTGNTNGNLTMHQWFVPTKCPGPYLKSRFAWIAEEVNRRLDTQGKPETPVEPENRKGDYIMDMRILRRDSRGEDVKALQILLKGRGYNCGSTDGVFGSKTENAVRNYQKAKKLGVDGIVGPATMGSLLGV